MKAIVTKYHGPTDTRGSRITASDEDGNRASIPYPHELNTEEAHHAAAVALCTKMNWKGALIAGHLKRGFVFVFAREIEAPMLTALQFIEKHKAALIGVECTGDEYEAAIKPAFKALQQSPRT